MKPKKNKKTTPAKPSLPSRLRALAKWEPVLGSDFAKLMRESAERIEFLEQFLAVMGDGVDAALALE